jgi:hypothetical protein
MNLLSTLEATTLPIQPPSKLAHILQTVVKNFMFSAFLPTMQKQQQ